MSEKLWFERKKEMTFSVDLPDDWSSATLIIRRPSEREEFTITKTPAGGLKISGETVGAGGQGVSSIFSGGGSGCAANGAPAYGSGGCSLGMGFPVDRKTIQITD
ncbi:hypothetical protein [Ralstonia pseudosolanacearum]|uniref:hypothetical protein n=1 Tax=Ralstonia pseudosolanacearum TaxID=1310165 RepID=UPI003F4FE727